MRRKNIILHTFIKLLGLTTLLLAFMPACLSQENEEEEFNWTTDTILTQRIDSLGEEAVRSELRLGLSRAMDYCKDANAHIIEDSATTWVTYARWAVILKDANSLDLLEKLAESLAMEERGQWQYYTTYMAMWGVYEAKTQNFTVDQKLDIIFAGMFDQVKIRSGFYEDRMIDLGSGGISSILNWVKAHLVPQMDELDKEMLSEEDYQFTRKYNRFLMVFSNMIVSDKDKAQIQNLKKDEHPQLQRFASDVLDLVEY